MILFKFKETSKVPKYAQKYVSGYRWVFEITLRKGALDIGFNHQYKPVEGAWRLGGGYYSCTVNRHWHWDEDHFWYDGPHCNRSIGFIHFNWRGWKCKKCADAC